MKRGNDPPRATGDPPSRKGKKKSAAERVVEQARARAAQTQNLTELPVARLESGKDKKGNPNLSAVFPRDGGGEPYRVNLSFLLKFPGLTEAFSQGFLAWGRSQRQLTRIMMASKLARFWFRYLSEQGLSHLTPEHIDEQILAGFNQWLHGSIGLEKGNVGKPLSSNTIRKALEPLRNVLSAVSSGQNIADMVPPGPRGAKRKTEPTNVLSHRELFAIWAAAEKEVLALHDRWARGRSILAQGKAALQAGCHLERNPKANPEAASEDNLALCLAMLDATFPGIVPDITVINEHNSLLGTTIGEIGGSGHLTGYLYASPADLAPLVLLIALATAFNPDTNLGLVWSNINRNVDRLGTNSVAFDITDGRDDNSAEEENVMDAAPPLLKVAGDKPRANRQYVRLLDPTANDSSQASLNLVLDLLRDMTARIRSFALPEHRDRLYLYVQSTGPKRPKSFGDDTHSPSGDSAWKTSLKKFIRDHDLPKFTLKNIRATLIDFVQLVNRGDLEKARQVGDHSSRQITWTHYTSDLVRRLLKEATGEILLTRDRWIDTGGVIDPRKSANGAGKACATPGFDCADPFNSPRPNQRSGQLCSAYGECPSCPIVMAKPGNPMNVAWWEALRLAIFGSIGSITATMWQTRWAPVAADLNALIATVPVEVLAKSRRFRVQLPKVG